MRVVVTGGAGFIGGHLVRGHLAAGDEVVVVDDLSTGSAEGVDVELIVHDVAEGGQALAEAFRGAEIVHHLAAHRAVLRSVEDPVATDRANTAGTLNVLVAARESGVRRVVVASSSSVYGGAEVLPTPEQARLNPRSPYAVSKVAAEHYSRVFAEVFDLETVSIRPFNVFGPGQPSESRYAAVIPAFIGRALSGQSPEVHGDGTQTRDFTYVSDVVSAFMSAGLADASTVSGRAYNVGGGAPVSLLGLLDELAKLVPGMPEPIFSGPRPGDVAHTHADLSSARSDLGYAPKVTFADGLARTVKAFTDPAPHP